MPASGQQQKATLEDVNTLCHQRLNFRLLQRQLRLMVDTLYAVLGVQRCWDLFSSHRMMKKFIRFQAMPLMKAV